MQENFNKNEQTDSNFVEPQASVTPMQKVLYEFLVNKRFTLNYVVDQINQNILSDGQKLNYADVDEKQLSEDICKFRNLRDESEITLENMPDDKEMKNYFSDLYEEKQNKNFNKEYGNKNKLNKFPKNNKVKGKVSALEITKNEKKFKPKNKNKSAR